MTKGLQISGVLLLVLIEVRRNTPSFSEAAEKPLVQWTLHFLKFFQENTYKILTDNSAYK